MHGKLRTTGIEVEYGYAGGDKYGWWARVGIHDLGHCENESVRGHIGMSYANELGFAVDTIKKDADSLGIEFVTLAPLSDSKYGTPNLSYIGDGESNEYPPPEGWQIMLSREAERIGFKCHHDIPEKFTVPKPLFAKICPDCLGIKVIYDMTKTTETSVLCGTCKGDGFMLLQWYQKTMSWLNQSK
ncbi:MAG: hypothetical protein GY928_08490 [Colwellia sp.]|nr:hypothetical protein [Colwellia sp.]